MQRVQHLLKKSLCDLLFHELYYTKTLWKIFFPVAGEKDKHWRNILPRLLCATAFHSEGTCSGFGVSSALRRQICTAKAPWELQREKRTKSC